MSIPHDDDEQKREDIFSVLRVFLESPSGPERAQHKILN